MTTIVDDYRLLMADVYEVAGLSRRTAEALASAAGQALGRLRASSARERARMLGSAGLAAADLRQARSTLRELAAVLRAGA